MNGQVVRLRQGKASEKTVYSDDPVAFAKKWERDGGDWLHIIDLDAAFDGVSHNLDSVKKITEAISIPCQLGGGMRSGEAIARALDAGVARVIIGTRACESMDFVSEMVARFGGDRIAVGIDAKNGVVSVKGWTESSNIRATDLARRAEKAGAGTIIYTDIATDGMLTGPNFSEMKTMLDLLDCRLIASGGVFEGRRCVPPRAIRRSLRGHHRQITLRRHAHSPGIVRNHTMKILYLDCISGISGDMTVGALTDLGIKPSTFEWELSKLDIGEFHMHFERKQSQAIEGIKFGIHEGATHKHDQDEEEHDHEHHSHEPHASHEARHHEHDHGHHGHEHHHSHGHEHSHGRNHAEIRALIEKSDLTDFVKKHALAIFHRIAEAEGKIHGVPPEKVAFHEVGALDSIADIVLACVGIEQLGVEKIFVSPLSEGRGWLHCAHGKFPIPSPATLEILAGIPLAQIDEEFEFITPTGAAIVAEFGSSFGLMPPIKVQKIGYGLGSRQLPHRPNVLRAVLGEVDEKSGGYETDTITRIETNIDDLSPEITGAAMDKLFAAGALDVFFTSIQMKKNRPAIQLTALCENADVPKIADIIFTETTSFGIRMDQVSRLKLDRKFVNVKTEFGGITVKLGLKGGKVIQIAPEYESVRAASEKSGASLRAIYEAARKAAS